MATRNLALEQVVKAEERRKELASEGVLYVEKPPFDIPKVVVQLAELSDDRLMKLFVTLTRWTDYLGMEVALAFIEERSIERIVERAEALAIIGHWGGTKEDRVTISKAERTIDPTVIEWADKLDVAYATRKLKESMFQACERDAALVSRELTRRVGKRESNERRADRWGGGA